MFAKCTQTPFIAKVILLGVLILDEAVVFLIYRVVGQMHELVLLVYLLGVSL
jgi:hypothetical protein